MKTEQMVSPSRLGKATGPERGHALDCVTFCEKEHPESLGDHGKGAH